ncbi:Intercellular signal essential for a variety of patterning events during development (By similarity) [Seminavis robusta]|uniref:Intercellular signal essential for a variety of patterning events during development By similarity n=1 Tax=Seminavis robusta TaxID=568900 RepID=A0A9N8H517_9STRA|nr:Intercellular signal essential for a variety of patterning events during development (By similarity) [Seminavis robusta]|eukprot:Sro75_g041390.1 Intercellular signal essential for a variety of patterning events during development (By similarity) (851) ;mRNA; f:102270-104822
MTPQIRWNCLAMLILTVFLSHAMPSVFAFPMSDQDSLTSASFVNRILKKEETDSPTMSPTAIFNGGRNNDKNNNDKNNNDKNKNDKDENTWARPWDVVTGPPTDKPSKAPTTPRPTKAPTTDKPSQFPTVGPTSGRPTWAPVTRWPSPAPVAAVAASSAAQTPRPTPFPSSSAIETPQPTPLPTRLPTTPRPTRSPTTPRPSPLPSQMPITAAPITRQPTPLPGLPTRTPTTSPPTLSPTPNPSSPPTLSPTPNPSSPPTLSPTPKPSPLPTNPPSTSPTDKPTFNPTMPRTFAPIPGVPNPTSPAPTSAQPMTPDPTTLAPVPPAQTAKAKPAKTEELEAMQVIPFGAELQNISIAFSVWFPDRSGVNEADHDSMSATIQTALSSTLEYLFCDSSKSSDYLDDLTYWDNLGLENYKEENRLCAFVENVVHGDGLIGAVASPASGEASLLKTAENGGRFRLLQGGQGNNNLQAYEEGKWDVDEWKDLDEKFATWEQSNRAGDGGGQAIYAVEPNDNKNNDNTDNNNKDNDTKDDTKEDEDNKDNQQQQVKEDVNQGQQNEERANDAKANQENPNDDKNKDKENEKEKNDKKNQGKAETAPPIADVAVMLQPPHLHHHVHFNAHKNLAYTSWNVSWPVVRLTMSYLEQSWNTQSKNGDTEAEDVVAYGIALMQQELKASLKENVNLRVLDVILEDLLKEPVRVSVVGHEKETFGMDILLEEGDHMGYNMTAAEKQEMLNPHPLHAMRLVGMTLLLFTLKFIAILLFLSRRRKLVREAELKRHREGKGMLEVNGVEEMLKKTKTARRDVIATMHDNPRRSRSDSRSEREYEMRIPMPAGLGSTRRSVRAAAF